MDIVIITGMSGAGKTAALDIFEDMGYYSMDNLPPSLISNFADLSRTSQREIEKMAVVVDIRGGLFFDDLVKQVSYLKQTGEKVSVLFLDATDEKLVTRYKELRRPHPLNKSGNPLLGITEERTELEEIKGISDYYIDTTSLTLGEFKSRIHTYYSEDNTDERKLHISVVSFGFKNGIMLDADLVFDVRFLPNPYYIKELKNHNGTEKPVSDFVFNSPATHIFVEKTMDMLEFLIPHYLNEGKNNLVIGIGCTGGKHRSVAIAEKLGERLESLGESAYVSHRDAKYWK